MLILIFIFMIPFATFFREGSGAANGIAHLVGFTAGMLIPAGVDLKIEGFTLSKLIFILTVLVIVILSLIYVPLSLSHL